MTSGFKRLLDEQKLTDDAVSAMLDEALGGGGEEEPSGRGRGEHSEARADRARRRARDGQGGVLTMLGGGERLSGSEMPILGLIATVKLARCSRRANLQRAVLGRASFVFTAVSPQGRPCERGGLELAGSATAFYKRQSRRGLKGGRRARIPAHHDRQQRRHLRVPFRRPTRPMTLCDSRLCDAPRAA